MDGGVACAKAGPADGQAAKRMSARTRRRAFIEVQMLEAACYGAGARRPECDPPSGLCVAGSLQHAPRARRGVRANAIEESRRDAQHAAMLLPPPRPLAEIRTALRRARELPFMAGRTGSALSKT